MAIISCPACSKTISDKAQACQHCNVDLSKSSAEDIQRKLSNDRFEKLHKLQNQSMLAILIFVVGVYFVFLGDFSNDEKGVLMYNLSVTATAIGFIWYAVNRVRITLTKRG